MEEKNEATTEKKRRGPKPKFKQSEDPLQIIGPALVAPFIEPKTDHAETSPRESALEKLMAEGIPYEYMKFQGPVPAGLNMEPVYELKTFECKDKKYKVDQISLSGHTVYWRRGSLIQSCPWVNVQHGRPLTEM